MKLLVKNGFEKLCSNINRTQPEKTRKTHRHRNLMVAKEEELWGFEAHVATHRESGRGFACDRCGKVFRANSTQRAHIWAEHIDPQDWPHVCRHCGKRNWRSENHQQHEVVCQKIQARIAVAKEEGKAWVCPHGCRGGKPFISKWGFKVHLEQHKEGRKGFVCDCDPCKKVCSSRDALKKHIRAKHTDPATWPHACRHCAKRFWAKGHHKAHEAVCLGIQTRAAARAKEQEGALVCPRGCREGRPFATRTTLKRHMIRRHQEGKKGLACSRCDKVFNLPDDLRAHFKTRHTDPTEWPHACRFCSKPNWYLSRHKLHEAGCLKRLQSAAVDGLVRISIRSNLRGTKRKQVGKEGEVGLVACKRARAREEVVASRNKL